MLLFHNDFQIFTFVHYNQEVFYLVLTYSTFGTSCFFFGGVEIIYSRLCYVPCKTSVIRVCTSLTSDANLNLLVDFTML